MFLRQTRDNQSGAWEGGGGAQLKSPQERRREGSARVDGVPEQRESRAQVADDAAGHRPRVDTHADAQRLVVLEHHRGGGVVQVERQPERGAGVVGAGGEHAADRHKTVTDGLNLEGGRRGSQQDSRDKCAGRGRRNKAWRLGRRRPAL